jgi:soluble lytic murein transglycosylase-like protein
VRWYRPLIDAVLLANPVKGLDANLLDAIVRTESSGEADAFRHEPGYWKRYCEGHPVFGKGEPRRIASSYGLMQVMYPTAHAFGYRGEPEGLFLPQQSLLYGVRVMQDNLKWSKGHLDAALAAYNGGKTKDNLSRPYRNGYYVSKVRKHLADIQEGR